MASGLLFAAVLTATVPTVGDIGLTWDEPAYRFSQMRSAEWWSRLASARSAAEIAPLVEPDALLFYWTYARHGINFHPPLAGQLNLLTYELFGRCMKDTPARRMASILEFALTITIGFSFLARRYGAWVGVVMAGSLLFMPRVYGNTHIAETDTPGLLLWTAASLAFWNGLHEPAARRWRVLVGVLLGLAFIEKMSTVFVLAPLFVWLVVARLPLAFRAGTWKNDWADGLLTAGSMLLPLAITFLEILRLAKVLPRPNMTNLFYEHPPTHLPGFVLALPMGVWIVRRAFALSFPRSALWGGERPGLEIVTAVMAFAPLIGWLGNPAWWRETIPRLAHYYLINTDRRGSLPDIQILYLGQTYEYSLPWHNGWVLIAITVPATILAASLFGVAYACGVIKRDRLPLYFGLQFLALPVFRMLPTPAHDGVRLMLPTFFFLAAFSGWGAIAAADWLNRRLSMRREWPIRALMSALVLVPAGWQLIKIHPYELSYYNELIGGPRGAWKHGFELAYWYDAFNEPTLAEINARLPKGATIDFLNDMTRNSIFLELQSLGELRSDLIVGGLRDPGMLPYSWIHTQDSKATAFTRLLFALTPWYESRPKPLDGLRVAGVADPVAVTRAYALWMMLDAPDRLPPDRPEVPGWVDHYVPFLGRFWGRGLTKVHRLTINKALLDWAHDDPAGFLAAAKDLSEHQQNARSAAAKRLLAVLDVYARQGTFVSTPLAKRPEAILEAARIIVARPDDLRTVLTRFNYTDPADIGGPLDKDLPGPNATDLKR